MNILFIAKHFYPHIGGVEKHLKEVSVKLKEKRKDIKITIVCEWINGTRRHEMLDGVEVYRIKFPHTKGSGLLMIWWWFLKNHKLITRADVVHIHDVFIWYLPLRFLFWGKQVFSTFHGWEGVYPVPLKNKIIRQLSALLSAGNICVGEYIEKWYGIRATHVIYGGAEIQNSKFKTQNYKTKIKILYIGRLDEDTGIRTYLKAFKLIKHKYPKTEIEFLGDGIFRADAADLGPVHGFVKDITPYLKKTRFVCTSGYLSMLEALSLKRLVFSTSNNQLKSDAIKLSPFEKYVIHFKFPDTFVRKISFFVKYPKREREIVEGGYGWAREQSWDKVTDTYLSLWNNKYD